MIEPNGSIKILKRHSFFFIHLFDLGRVLMINQGVLDALKRTFLFLVGSVQFLAQFLLVIFHQIEADDQ